MTKDELDKNRLLANELLTNAKKANSTDLGTLSTLSSVTLIISQTREVHTNDTLNYMNEINKFLADNSDDQDVLLNIVNSVSNNLDAAA